MILLASLYYENSISLIETNSGNLATIPNQLTAFTQIEALVAIIAAVTAIFIGFVTVYYQNKQKKFNALIELFKVLNDDKHREARQSVYEAYREFTKGQTNAFTSNTDRKCRTAMVRADFDQMGILLVNNLIPKDVFLGAYWHTVLLCWKALKQNIANERDVRANPSYMQHFQKLKVEAESYWREHHSEVKEIKL